MLCDKRPSFNLTNMNVYRMALKIFFIVALICAQLWRILSVLMIVPLFETRLISSVTSSETELITCLYHSWLINLRTWTPPDHVILIGSVHHKDVFNKQRTCQPKALVAIVVVDITNVHDCFLLQTITLHEWQYNYLNGSIIIWTVNSLFNGW